MLTGIIISPVENGSVLCKRSSVKQTRGVLWTPPSRVPWEEGAQSWAGSQCFPPDGNRQPVRHCRNSTGQNSPSRTPTSPPPAHTGQRSRLTNDSDTQTPGAKRKHSMAWRLRGAELTRMGFPPMPTSPPSHDQWPEMVSWTPPPMFKHLLYTKFLQIRLYS